MDMVLVKEDIKDIRFSSFRSTKKLNGNCGLCSVAVADCLVIHGVKVRKRGGRYEVALPERRVGKDDESKPVVTLLSLEFKEHLTAAVLNKYFSLLEK